MEILDRFPLWAVYLGTVIIAFVATEIGYRFGIWLRRRNPSFGESDAGGIVVGGMLALLAFLLALSVATVVGQHNDRKALVVTEANAIGTAYLRAGFLSEPDRTTSRDLLREYVAVRLAPATDRTLFESSLARSEEIQVQLWRIVAEQVNQGEESATMALYVESINEVIDVHTLRLTAIERRLPRRLGIMMYGAIILSFLLMGVAASRDEKPLPRLATLLYALALTAIFVIVVDLDRPQGGLVTVSQQALADLLNLMATSGS